VRNDPLQYHTLLGDKECNEGEHNIRHRAAVNAVCTALNVTEASHIILGDKNQHEEKFRRYNAGKTLDLGVVGGAPAGRNLLVENKVPSPMGKTHAQGQGTTALGGSVTSVGHRFAFGNTEEKLRHENLGCKQRGAPGQHALCHTTGKGFVKEKKGLYHDALKNQRATVIVAITESFGGICPELYSFYHKRGKRVRSKALADRTVYSRHRLAPKTFKRHHLLHLSVEVQRADANHINEQVLLARYCAVRKDQMDGGVGRSDSSDSHSSGSDSPDEGGDDDDGDDSRDALQDQWGGPGPGDDTSEGAAV